MHPRAVGGGRGGGGGGGGGDGDDSDGGGGGAAERGGGGAADILEPFRVPQFVLEGITGLLDEVGPYQIGFLQECERLNVLLDVMTQSLTELDLGFRGELTMSEAMEAVQTSLFMDRVPAVWQKVAFPSQRGLGLWTVNLQSRLTQMADWATAPSEIPVSTWISGLFNPQSFLTAIMQITAQAQALELDKLVIFTEVTKKLDGADVAAPDGAFIHGLSLEGARWSVNNSLLETSQPRNVLAAAGDQLSARDERQGRVGQLRVSRVHDPDRGPTFVFKAALQTKAPRPSGSSPASQPSWTSSESTASSIAPAVTCSFTFLQPAPTQVANRQSPIANRQEVNGRPPPPETEERTAAATAANSNSRKLRCENTRATVKRYIKVRAVHWRQHRDRPNQENFIGNATKRDSYRKKGLVFYWLVQCAARWRLCSYCHSTLALCSCP